MCKISRFYDSACIDLLTNFTDFIIFYRAESFYLPHKPSHTLFRGAKVKKHGFTASAHARTCGYCRIVTCWCLSAI